MADTLIPLAQDFDAPSRADWLAIVEKTLKGASFDKKLVSRTYDGVEIQPLYTAGDAAASPARAASTAALSARRLVWKETFLELSASRSYLKAQHGMKSHVG